jgi:drug/metabolite transporter (DMT)-like permease
MKGYVLAIMAAVLWGVSGTFAQFLFANQGFNVEWVVTVRLLTSGAVFLMFAYTQSRESVWKIWRTDAVPLVIFGLFGMLAVQYTYFITIKHSNAATATILQYLGPVFIAAYYAILEKRWPRLFEMIALVFAVSGTFLLVSHGRFDALMISPPALVWGLISAVALATYSILPEGLLKRHSSAALIGWGMLIGGVTFSFVHAPWNFEGAWSNESVFSLFFIIVFGTLVPFYAYLNGVKLIGATKASLLACAEPLAASLLAVLWLGVSLTAYDWIGGGLIIATILILTAFNPKASH